MNATKVREFHEKHNFPVNIGYGNDRFVDLLLDGICGTIGSRASEIRPAAITSAEKGDHRLYRAHLMMEELSEVLLALRRKNDLDLADGLGDLLYVIVGTAVTYGIPIEEVFDEIHRSNMTKKIRDPKSNFRMKDKGESYSPPDLESILNGIRDSRRDVAGRCEQVRGRAKARKS